MQVFLQCGFHGFRLRDEASTTDRKRKCLGLVKVAIPNNFAARYDGPDRDDEPSDEFIIVEVLERCVHCANPFTDAMATDNDVPTPLQCHVTKGYAGRHLVAEVVGQHGQGGLLSPNSKAASAAALRKISMEMNLANNLSGSGGANTNASRQLVHQRKQGNRRPLTTTSSAREEAAALFDLAHEVTQRLKQVIFRIDLATSRYLVTDTNRLQTTVMLTCAGDGGVTALKTVGIALDSTMKIVKLPNPREVAKPLRMWTTVGAIRSPNDQVSLFYILIWAI